MTDGQSVNLKELRGSWCWCECRLLPAPRSVPERSGTSLDPAPSVPPLCRVYPQWTPLPTYFSYPSLATSALAHNLRYSDNPRTTSTDLTSVSQFRISAYAFATLSPYQHISHWRSRPLRPLFPCLILLPVRSEASNGSHIL